jgi:aminodeoxyfutalosine deaminase
MSFISDSLSASAAVTILRARVVVPVSGPPIEDGAVSIRGNRIASVGRWRDLSISGGANVVDLGKMVLLPGLVNAHCHLDYTHMAGEIPPATQLR